MVQWVTFLVGQRVMTVRDDEIADVVRDAVVEHRSGLRAPITASMDYHDGRLELVDLREHEARADVLVLLRPAAGVVVDGVLAMVDEDALEVEEAVPDGLLPHYVRAVLRRPDASGSRVYYVDLAAFAGLRAQRPSRPGA
ncbi:hypothetical protein EV189_3823 [Motilibacter rhizosphaerae]|uniref:Uncharacterized protein n=1 Tax=Motilibacter rhizosphaerae TaxID=598652 RepID=A0A4Q7NBB7_9ACTN|nr:hypothetical protein [Motilibacter rhizosphaerae]RZS79469.1 hypothetical protein EV189_3823 [Motilibacter rhizosphaerae]